MEAKESTLQHHVQRLLEDHAQWLGQCWTAYCIQEAERQETLRLPCATSTKLFLRDHGLDPRAPISEWLPRLVEQTDDMAPDARRKVAGLLHELQAFRDVCIAGNASFLQNCHHGWPDALAAEYDALTIDDLPTWRLLKSASSSAIREQKFALRHFATEIVPTKNTKKRTASQMEQSQEDNGYATRWLERQADIVQMAGDYVRRFCLWIVGEEWKLLKTEPSELKATPADWNDDDGDQDMSERKSEVKNIDLSYVEPWITAWASFQTAVRMRHLANAHQRWMMVAQPWLKAAPISDQKQKDLLAQHAVAHEHMSVKLVAVANAMADVDDTSQLDRAIADRKRVWDQWLETFSNDSIDDIERKWSTLRRLERERVEHFLAHSQTPAIQGWHAVRNGYKKQRDMEQEFRYAFQPAEQEPGVVLPSLPSDLLPAKSTLLLADTKQQRAAFTQLFDSYWFPTADKVEQCLSSMKWPTPAALKQHAEAITHVPAANSSTWHAWLSWVDHVCFTLSCYGRLTLELGASAL